MFYDRWSTKVTLPLGAKWGNNIGGVAACLNWSGGRGAKPPLPKSEFSTLQYNNHHHKTTPRKNGYKSGTQPKNVYYASDFTNPPNDYYYDGRSDDKYISIIPWQEDLGLARGADGKLKIAKTEPLGGYYESHPGEGTYRSGVTARPSTGGTRYGGRTVRAATPKGYGFMGPPPTPPRRPGTSTAFRRSTRPINPTPTPRRDNPSSTSRQEVYKYTERELIVEDLDNNGNDVTTGRASRSQSRAGGSGSRAGYPTARHNAYADVWRPNTGTGRRDYQLPVDRDEFSPTPLVWQSREFDNPIPPAKILSTRSKSFSTRPKTASGSLSKDVRVNVGSMGHRTVEDTVKLSDYHTHRAPSTSRSPAENVTIHVDCSKLVNSTRPASLTVRLHGVDSNDAENIKINTTPFK